MKVLTIVIIVLLGTTAYGVPPSNQDFSELKDELLGHIKKLGRQVMMQQFFIEQKIRADGSSGFKDTRRTYNGPANYYSDSHLSRTFVSIHDHADFRGTIGMGENTVVLNGVEFRTRHNDFKLNMPSTTSREINAVEPIPFPEVPPEVLKKKNIDDQIEELTEWFRAFQEQNYTVRDYRKYFKPCLCYLEGAWTLDEQLVEPFQSDRHFVDAKSWEDLMTKVQYNAYTGTKNRNENYSFLPTTILSIDDKTDLPNYAQWNYRILCKPTPMDIPTSYLKQLDDVAYRYPRGYDFEKAKLKRGARFILYEKENNFDAWTLLDEIFYTIPGKDNIPGNLTELGDLLFRMDKPGLVPMNTGYYHRWFKFSKAGAMGTNKIARGFNDEWLWVAQTTQESIAGLPKKKCVKRKVVKPGQPKQLCTHETQRFSYAIPLEVIYLTPLQNWNPYHIRYFGEDEDAAKEGGRNGKTKETALKGSYLKANYHTPSQFLSNNQGEVDPADTALSGVWVEGKDGTARLMKASGSRIIIGGIGDVRQIRLRYPIAPVHGEGSAVWKELNAFRDMQLNEKSGKDAPKIVLFQMSYSKKVNVERHLHHFMAPYFIYEKLLNNATETYEVTTSSDAGHIHQLRIRYYPNDKRWRYDHCDDKIKGLCWDAHSKGVFPDVEDKRKD